MSTNITSRYVGTTQTIHQRVAEIAQRQKGYVTLAQLLHLGLSHSGITRMVAQGHLYRRHRGVYAVGFIPDARPSEFMAAVLATSPGSALGYGSAAEYWGWGPSSSRWPEIVVPRNHHPLRRVTVHRTRSLFDDEVIEWDRQVLTTFERTLVDLSIGLSVPVLTKRIVDAVFHFPLRFPGMGLDFHQLLRIGRRQRNRTGFAYATLLEAVHRVLDGQTGARSWAEQEMFDLVKDLAPEPIMCKRLDGVEVEGRLVEPDLLWAGRMLIVEVDGPIHLLPIRKAYDERRDAVLRAVGYRVIRFTVAELRAQPGLVRAAVQAALVA